MPYPKQRSEEQDCLLPSVDRSPIHTAPLSPRYGHPSLHATKRRLSTGFNGSDLDAHGPPVKKYKRSAGLEALTPDASRARSLSSTRSPKSQNRERFTPENIPSIEVANMMLSRPEDTGGTGHAKLTRGLVPGSSTSTRQVPNGPSRHSSDHSGRHSLRPSEGRSLAGNQRLYLVGITELLQQDDRPTFVIDVDDDLNIATDGFLILFANAALKFRPGLLDQIQGISGDPTLMLDLDRTFADFKQWALARAHTDDVAAGPPPFEFAGLIWRFSIVQKRLRVFHGQLKATSQSETENMQRPGLQMYKGLTSSTGTPQLRSDTSGYLAPREPSTRAETPGTMEALLHTDGAQELSQMPEEEEDEEEVIPASVMTIVGDMGIGEMIENALSPSTEQKKALARNNTEGSESIYISPFSDTGFFDWTRLPLNPSLPPHVQFARSVDWGATSIGPIENWTPDLRGMCNLIMASPHPAAMYWGKDHVAIYNEPYIPLAGKKHPELMGSRYQDAWLEIWGAIEDVFANAMTSAEATMKDDDCLFLHRNGYLEETYFSWSIIPLIGEDGSVVGLYNPAFEKTRRKIAERRMLTLREVGEKTAAARHVSQFWGLLLEGLEYNEYDAPLVMVYSLQDETLDSDAGSGNGLDTVSATSGSTVWSKQCHFEGALGISAGHPAAPPQVDLRVSTEGFTPYFRQAMRTNRPVILREEDGTLDATILDNVQWRGFGDPSRVVVISPIHPTTGESTLGFLIMATNPRRPYDEDYDLFVQLLGRQLATSVASVVLFEEEIRKSEIAAKMAAQDRIELSNQLAARTKEAIESENKFTRFAQLAPVGMFMADHNGKFTFTNDAWHDISAYPRNRSVGSDWFHYINEDDQAEARKAWDTMLNEMAPVSIEFRFKRPWKDKMGTEEETWVLVSSHPQIEQGKLKGVLGSVTDISAQKQAEKVQKKRMEDAVELKRQQESFVDMTSHEMRNPLSAILQCSDEISITLTELKNAAEALSDVQAEIIDSSIDAAQTITLCAQHQKRIVDDVLTLSKLDSAMLLVTPVDAQPVTVVQRALKMFEGELQNADISLELKIQDSFHALKVDYVRLDPSRLLQVLINLTTNAIKFTTTQEKRTIVMHVGASKEPPTREDKYNITYVPIRNQTNRDSTAAPEWGDGEPIYIQFAVEDTGTGLTDAEVKLLFQRFSQASPRTHITYGGSGLGLFISRELVELQGGQIGVASESGTGSTFAFFIKARRSPGPVQGGGEEQIESMQSRKGSANKNVRLLPTASTKLTGGISQPTKQNSGYNTRPKISIRKQSATAEPDHLNVLIVEDNLVNQKVLAKQLRKVGCTVYVANHGGEAIEQIQRSRFWHTNASIPISQTSSPRNVAPVEPSLPTEVIDISVVLLDLEMPVMDGQTCVRRLREMQNSGLLVRHVPVIAVTANAREEQIKMTLEAGIDDVVSKPFRIPELLPKIKALIAKCNERQIQAEKVETE